MFYNFQNLNSDVEIETIFKLPQFVYRYKNVSRLSYIRLFKLVLSNVNILLYYIYFFYNPTIWYI